jgi:bacterioferritin-associated ferredoxin
MIVCVCNNVSDRKIRQAIDAGMTTMPQLREHLDVGTCCGKCHVSAKKILKDSLADTVPAQPMLFHPAHQTALAA